MRDAESIKNNLLKRDIKNADCYWKQSAIFDKRPFDTKSILNNSINQLESEQAFVELFIQRKTNARY